MKITDLFAVDLPAKEVTLYDRGDELRKSGVAFSIYARNLIPFQLDVTVIGNRQLAVAEFETKMSVEDAQAEIKRNGQYQEATIEDFLAVVGDKQLDDKQCEAIVCTKARFNSPGNGEVDPYMWVEEQEQEGDAKKRVRNIGLVPKDATFNPGVKFLLVKK